MKGRKGKGRKAEIQKGERKTEALKERTFRREYSGQGRRGRLKRSSPVR